MTRVLVAFGTTDGQTGKIARAIRDRLEMRGCHTHISDLAHDQPDPHGYDAVVVAASVHAGGYQRYVVRWASKHATVLASKPTAFVSVCLAILEHNPKVDGELHGILDAFYRSTSWHPGDTKIVAGALKYSQYNLVKRWVMKRIAKKAGGGTDTTRDYEYTDWDDLHRFVDSFTDTLRMPSAVRSA